MPPLEIQVLLPSSSQSPASRRARVLIAPTSEGTRNVYAVRPEGFESVRAYLERFWDDALPRFQLVAENLESLDD